MHIKQRVLATFVDSEERIESMKPIIYASLR